MTPQTVLDFWLSEIDESQWYQSTPELDALITSRFLDARNQAKDGKLKSWQECAEGSLALLLLLDQFSRNMFRGDAEAFAADPLARDIARTAIENDHDLQIEGAPRQFFYLPFEHSESLADQNYAIELFKSRAGLKELSLLHAKAHRAIIEKFGRFPFRNKALGRVSSDEELEFMSSGGYGQIVKEIQNQTD